MSIAYPFWAALDRAATVDTGGTVLTGRCEIFGPHDTGPRHLQGGRFGPEYNGRIHWHCRNPQEVRVRIHCRYAHACAQCSGHCGTRVIPICREHWAMFMKRMNRACTACSQPPEQISLEEAYYDTGHRFAGAQAAGDLAECSRLAVRLADIEAAMAELITRGKVRRAELFMVEVS